MASTIVEQLIQAPGNPTTALLFEDSTEFFWVDWREDDAGIVEACEDLLGSQRLSAVWEGERLVIHCGEARTEVPLTTSPADRHITLVALNAALHPHHEIRMAWDSDGNDTLAFTVQSAQRWRELEATHGEDKVARAFLRLTASLNTFTDPLHGHRPQGQAPGRWWQFWK